MTNKIANISYDTEIKLSMKHPRKVDFYKIMGTGRMHLESIAHNHNSMSLAQ